MKEALEMSSVMTSWRQRRQVVRTRRALREVVQSTSSPAMRDELLVMAGRGRFLG
ncbi:MAG TPA: hypothetical protein VD834_07660 [Blastococcus sp.]|jgi:hypothetical protein|nr:hypothetical protein [Blastococcus sp.]